MFEPTNECYDRILLTEFLNEQLEEKVESSILEHINGCSQCQNALENIAAGTKAWSDLKTQLADHLDLDVTSETAPFQSRDRDLEMEKLKEYLGPTDNPDMLGRLGSYEVCGLVGRGSTGVVVKALDTRLNRFVAIKVLSPSFASNGPARTRFEREGRSVAAVSHEHVVPIHGVNEYRGLPFIVMHYVGGGSLHQRIERNGPLDTCEVVRIGMQIARGLAAAHGQGIIHRDVKPANVMLESGVDRAMVSDFGLARVADEAAMTRSGVIAGTPQYMSPEQAMGDPIDPRSDLFSLGSVLYTACTGRPPFRSETVFGVIKRVCESQPRPIREINPNIASWLEALIAKLHEKDREDRFESADNVAEVLNRELAYLQSPSFVAEPDRPWFVEKKAAAPTKPAKSAGKSDLWMVKWVVAATLLGIATWASLFQQGIVPLGLKSDMFASGSKVSALVSGPNDQVSGDGYSDQGEPYKTLQLRSGETARVGAFAFQENDESEGGTEDSIVIAVSEECTSNVCEDECECDGACEDCECSQCECSQCECSQCECECGDDHNSECSDECDLNGEASRSHNHIVIGQRGIPGKLVAVKKEYSDSNIDGYMIYLPASYEASKNDYPVIMFLQGGCGVGGKIEDLHCWCLPQRINDALDTNELNLEDQHKKLMLDSFIIVVPHMTGGAFEERQFFEQENAIAKMLQEMQQAYRLDSNRVYLTGTGRGGHGTWGLASRMPELFAAIAPLRGMRFGIKDYGALAEMPIWIGHNVDDDVVEFEETEAVIAKLAEMGAKFYVVEEENASSTEFMMHSKILTSYEDDEWPDLYASAPLYKWFLSHERTSQANSGKHSGLDSITLAVTDSSVSDENALVVAGLEDAAIQTTSLGQVEEEHATPVDEAELQTFESNVERSFDVQADGKLRFRSHLGNVKLKTIDGNTVSVLIRRSVRAKSAAAAEGVFSAQKIDFDVEQHGLESGRDVAIAITLDQESAEWQDGVEFETMECVLGLPAKFNVDVETSAGNITIPDVNGIVKLRTSGGHIELAGCSKRADVRTTGGNLVIGDVAGDLVGKTSGGHIKVETVSGEAKLKTAGGHITVDHVVGSIDAQTAGGNIHVSLRKQPLNDMVFKTSAGNVVIGLMENIGLDVNASVSIGRIVGTATSAEPNSNRNNTVFSINGGGPNLEVTTSAGNIELNYIEP